MNKVSKIVKNHGIWYARLYNEARKNYRTLKYYGSNVTQDQVSAVARDLYEAGIHAECSTARKHMTDQLVVKVF